MPEERRKAEARVDGERGVFATATAVYRREVWWETRLAVSTEAAPAVVTIYIYIFMYTRL